MAKKTRKRFDTGGYMAHGGKVELIFHGSSREIPMGEFDSAADAKRYVESSDWQRPYSIKKINKKPKVVRTQFEEEVFEYADGGETYANYEMVLIAEELEKDGGYKHKFRYLVSAKDINEAKNIVTEQWYEEMSNSDLSLVNIMSDEEYRLNHMGKMADGGQLYSDKFTYNLIGEDIRKFKYRSFSEQIENANKFKVLMQKVYDAQPSDDRYPLEFIKAQARSKFSIVKDNGKNYLYGYMYKGSLTHFPFLDDKNFVEALKYVDRPAIRKLEDGGMTMAKGGETKPSLIPDYKKISNVEVEDIDRDDYPDFSDAYISYAEYDGEPMTDEQLEELNQDGLFVYDAIHMRLFADGGMMDEIQFDRDRNGSLYDRGRADSYYGRAREPHWYPNGTYNGEMVTELTKKEIEEYNKGYNENTDFKDYGEMAKGGKVKSRWIQDALTGNKGALRRTAKRKGLIKGDEKLSKSDLRKLEKMGGKTARRARLAETLIDFKK